MINLLSDGNFVIEEYEFQRVHDPKGILEKPVKPERRWKVKFSSVPIASGFFSQLEAEKYIYKNSKLALWNALWQRGFQVSWDSSLLVQKFDVKHLNKEM